MHTGDTQPPTLKLHNGNKTRFLIFPRLTAALQPMRKPSYLILRARLKAMNTMTRFGSRSSNSCYFTPKQHQKTISDSLKSTIF